MRKTFLKVSILGMLTVGMAAGFTSCKDYDDDIDNLQTQIDAIQKDLKEIKDLVSSGVVITNVSQNADGVTITMSNNQTYTITNGKNGKDADVWKIVEKDGKYMWAKNDVVTEFPAQGPAGAPGAGIYYVPNKDGYFYKVEEGKDPVKTDIPCFAPGALTAVDDGSNIIISGILDKDGKETEPFVLSKTGALSSLEFIPDLYVDGIETMRAQYATGTKAKANTSANGENITGNVVVIGETGKASATIAKDAIVSFTAATGDNKTYTNHANNVAKYVLNPANANLSGINYSFKTNVAAIENTGRAAEDIISVVGKPDRVDGDLEVHFTIADYSKIYDQNNNVLDADKKPITGKQTVAALMATLPDNSVVASNFVAVEAQVIKFANIQYTYATDKWNNAYQNAYVAGTDASVLNGDYAKTLKLPYNEVSNLPEYIRVAYTVGDNTTPKYYTLGELAKMYGYTMNYSLLSYTTGAAKTEEAKYAKIAADGTLTPQYIGANGQAPATDGTNAARTAIGRMPVVILQLNDKDGNLILGGFVKVVFGEKATVESINLGDKALANVCEASITTPWDVFAGKVVAATGMTMQQFQATYKLNKNVIGVQVGDEIKEYSLAVTAGTPNYNNYCTPTINSIGGNAATQVFGFTFSQAQIANWYPTYDENTGKQNGTKLTQEPQTKTIYGKFEDKTSNSVIWIGYNVTVTGLPDVKYDGKLASQWVAGKDLVPAHPAIVSDAKYNAKAELITFTMQSLWNKGVPALSYTAPFQNTDKDAAGYVANEVVSYSFAVAQPSITTNVKNSDGEYIVYGFAGKGTKLYGIDITGLTGDDLKAAMNKAAAGTGTGVVEFATLTGDNKTIFTITAKTGMVDQVVNTNAFSMSDPKTLFNIEMNLAYGDGCTLNLPAFGNFQVGIGRPVDVVDAEKMMEITDGGADYTRPLYDLAMVQDWQGNKFWKKTTDKNGKVTSIDPVVLNGTDVFAFWMGNGGMLTFGWEAGLKGDALAAEMLTNTTPDVTTAVKGARKGFNILFGYGTADNEKNHSQMNVYNATSLLPTYVEYQKYGEGATTITAPFYVFVPVKATYVWGESNIGYATIKINPTKMGE